MIICVCQNVSERDIARAAARGCPSFAALQQELEVGMACGTCLGSARESFADHQAGCCGSRAAANGGLQPLAATASLQA